MESSTNLRIEDRLQRGVKRRGALVQDRPTLGSLPGARRGMGWWLVPVADFLAASIALIAVALAAEVAVFPAFPLAPAGLVVASWLLGVYSNRPARGLVRDTGVAWPVLRLLIAALFVWLASMLTTIGSGSQLLLWGLVVSLDTAIRFLSGPYLKGLEPIERWILVGEDETAERLRSFEPLKAHAELVCTVPAPEEAGDATRVQALGLVERYRADRVVIGSAHADEESLLNLVRAFKAVGVPVSLLPRPLDLLEAPAVNPRQVGGVPLLEVEALASRSKLPYDGPDRRRNRKTKITVVVPAMNEAGNIGTVLSELPDDLHEVILVDGNSTDNTIEAARTAYPDIRVLTQSGRGKGDAFRTGFAAVTGNLIVMLDADGSADPAEIASFVEALEAGADFAKGSRFLPGGGSADITPLRSAGNSLLSGSANLLHGTHFTDLCYGYNAFWARCLPFIALDVPGFEVETLINLRIAGAGMKITEVPSYEKDRISGHSNLNTFRDGFRVLRTILSEARRRRKIDGKRRPDATAAKQASPAATPTALP